MGSDVQTAQAFASSWNHLPRGSVYTRGQFEDWLKPLTEQDVAGKRVLELGCGNGSLMVHVADWQPSHLDGVDLGDSVITARKNLEDYSNVTVIQDDLVTYKANDSYDLVYCIGVLHHLQNPHAGFESIVRNTRPGGKFHCWVYAEEGNGVVMIFVEPIRKFVSRLPWWFTKHLLATPLVFPFYLYAKLLRRLPHTQLLARLPLYEYAIYMANREFGFFHHMAFDQLVTPQTAYIPKSTIESWLQSDSEIQAGSTYIIMRNGNSWKFGGVRKLHE